MHCDATGMDEKEIESVDLRYAGDYKRTPLQDGQYIFDHLFFTILGEATG